MPFCPNCGTEVPSSDKFCSICGGALTEGGDLRTGQQLAGAIPQTLPSQISLTRVLLMTVLSYGFYLFYWFYLTWQQYRDHTRTEVFPVWHALSILVPIYNLFRTHAHMSTFKKLMEDARLSTTISPGLAVVLVLIYSVLGWVSFEAGGRFSTEEITREAAVTIAILKIISISWVTALMLQAQSNLNTYWEDLASRTGASLAYARIGLGELVFSLLGILFWAITFLTLLSDS